MAAPAPRTDDSGADDTPWAAAATLTVAARRGDPFAMDELLALLAPYVGRLCRPIALGHAQDAAQEALIAIFLGLGRLKDPRALYGWVRTVTVREAVRVARRTARETPLPAADLPAPRSPNHGELAADVRDVLRRLPPEHRAVLALRELEGLDERTAAALLGVPPGTVKSRLHRARRGFRAAWAG